MYDLYVDKLKHSVYAKRVNSPLTILEEGRELFLSLSIMEQVRVLLNIHQLFGRETGGRDLSLIGGKEHAAATVSFSSTVSNWKKYYSDVRLLNVSSSGLWQKESVNLLSLL